MIAVAVKGITGRKLRTVLTSLAIVLGVAMVSGAFVLSDTMGRAADSLSSAAYRATDAVVAPRTLFKTDQFSSAGANTVAAKLVGRVRALPQVATAVGDLTNSETKLIGRDGKVIGTGPYFGVGYDAGVRGAARLTPFRLESGRYPRTPDQVAIDAGTAKSQHVGVGGQVRIEAKGPVRTFTVSGVVTFGDVSSIGTATVALFDLHVAQQVFREPGRYDSIIVAAKPGVSRAQLRGALNGALPSTVHATSAEAQDRFDLAGLKRFISFLRTLLLVFGAVAIFVGAFTIFNTFSIIVAQRTRELALLRSIGASRRQVLGSVVLEALAIGVLASLIGLVAGVGLGKLLGAVLDSQGLQLPQSGTVFAAHTVIISLLVGVLVTTLAALGPALRATRVSPVSAMREGATIPPSRIGRHGRKIAAAVGVLALAVLAGGVFPNAMSTTSRFSLIGAGTLLLFIGVALLSPYVAPALASVIGRPARRLGGSAGELARSNAMRNPRRTAATASALMIGIALVTFVAVLAQGLRSTTVGNLQRQVQADYVVTSSDGFSPIAPAVAGALRSGVPGVVVSPFKQDAARAFGSTTTVNAVDPASIAAAYHFSWKTGPDASLSQLRAGGAIVDSSFASKNHLRTGSHFKLQAQGGRTLELVVRGVNQAPKFNALGFGPITLGAQTFTRLFGQVDDLLAFVKVPGGVTAAATLALTARLAPFPDAKLMTRAAFIDDSVGSITLILSILYVLLAVSILVSLFGIVNTFVLSVFERTRELGTLRAIGMTRRQVRRMVRLESVITSLIGATIGIVVGLFLAAVVTSRLQAQGLEFSVPIGTLLTFVLLAASAGWLAGILPARRAAKLKPLEALAYE